jgi:tetratricopeptide (TPR) repeat protein
VYQVALLHQKFANYSEAENLFYQLFEVYTAKGSNLKAQRTLPYLKVKISLADLYFDTERHHEAQEVYKESIELSQLLIPETEQQYIDQLLKYLICCQKIGLPIEVDKKVIEIEKIYKTNKLQSRMDFLRFVLKKAEVMP